MKKILLIPIKIACLLLLFTAAYSCSDETIYNEVDTLVTYDLVLSANVFTFTHEGGVFTLDLETEYPDGWSGDKLESDWINEIDRTEKTVTYEAGVNDGNEIREQSATFRCGALTRTVHFIQDVAPGEKKKSNFFFINNYSGMKVSQDGRYIATYTSNSGIIEIYVTDTQTDETELVCSDATIQSMNAISNNGVIVGRSSVGGYYIQDKTLHIVDVSSSDDTFEGVSVEDISADGRVMVGYGNISSTKASGLKWVDGVMTQYPIPAAGRTSANAMGAYAVAVSPDGSIVVGSLYVGTSREAFYWKDDEVKWMGDIIQRDVEFTHPILGTMLVPTNFWSQNKTSNMSGRFSNNGKYFAGEFDFPGVGVSTAKIPVPALFDFETEEFVCMLEELTEHRFGASAVSAFDDGSMCYRMSVLNAEVPRGFIWKDGVISEARDIYVEEFGIDLGSEVIPIRHTPGEIIIGTFVNCDEISTVGFYAKVAQAE